MGRTIPSFRIASISEEQEWKLYRKHLGKTDKKQGSKMLNWIMVQCTHTHVRYCQSSITVHYNKIKNRKRNNKFAIIAAARKLMRVIYVMLNKGRSSL